MKVEAYVVRVVDSGKLWRKVELVFKRQVESGERWNAVDESGVKFQELSGRRYEEQ